MKFVISFGILVLTVISVRPLPDIGVLHEDSLERRQLILPPERFNTRDMELTFRGILSEASSDTSVLVVDAMDDRRSMPLSAIGITDVTYQLWRSLFRDYEKAIPPFAELLAIGTNSAMQLRDNQNRLSLLVLSGISPYELDSCGQTLHIIHASIGQGGSPWAPSKSSAYLHINLVADHAFDENTARCALGELRHEASVARISVSLRNDPWFIQDANFPVVSPFLTKRIPPTQDEYEQAPQWDCDSDHNQVACFGRTVKTR